MDLIMSFSYITTVILFSVCFFFKDLFICHIYSILPACMVAHQKRASDPILGGCEPPSGC